MLKNVYISDQFETWSSCRQKYYLKYIKQLRLPEPQINFRLGKSVHALACYYLRGFDIEYLEQSLDQETSNHWSAIKNHPIISNRLIATEWGFNANIGGTNLWLNGRIDAIFFDEKINKYIIVDWKTGQNLSKEPEKNFQTRIYLYSFFKAQKDLKLEIKHEDLMFQYIKTPDCQLIDPIYYSAEKEKEYEEQFRQITEEIESTSSFEKGEEVSQKSCKYCPYRRICL